MTARARWAVALLAAGAAGCFSPGPMPDDSYWRLAPAPPPARLERAPLDGVIVVERPEAPGVHGQRAIVYAEDPDHLKLERYHYHHWTDTPPRLVQQELVSWLRAANVASTVTADAGRLRADLRVSGLVRRFERQRTRDGWQAAVALELRVDAQDRDRPVLLREYAASVPAGDDSLEASARAFSEATASVFRSFLSDLSAALRPAN